MLCFPSLQQVLDFSSRRLVSQLSWSITLLWLSVLQALAVRRPLSLSLAVQAFTSLQSCSHLGKVQPDQLLDTSVEIEHAASRPALGWWSCCREAFIIVGDMFAHTQGTREAAQGCLNPKCPICCNLQLSLDLHQKLLYPSAFWSWQCFQGQPCSCCLCVKGSETICYYFLKYIILIIIDETWANYMFCVAIRASQSESLLMLFAALPRVVTSSLIIKETAECWFLLKAVNASKLCPCCLWRWH